MNGFEFPDSKTKEGEGRPLVGLLAGGVMLLMSLAGCQDGNDGESGDGEEIAKILHPPLVEVVRDGQREEGFYNYDAESGIYYQAVPGFVWEGELAEVDNRFADPEAYRYAGFAMQVETNQSRPSLEQICSSSTAIALYPPVATTTRSGVVFDPIVGLGNQSVVTGETGCGNEFFRLRALDDDGDGEWDRFRYSFPPGESSDTLLIEAVPGEWQLRSGANILANFQLPLLSPVEGGPFELPLPVPRINRDRESGLVESVDVRWWRYDPGAAGYQLMADSKGVPRSTVELGYTSGMSELHESYRAYGLVEKAVFPRYPWRLINDEVVTSDDPRVTVVQISYELDGVAYRFVWRASW